MTFFPQFTQSLRKFYHKISPEPLDTRVLHVYYEYVQFACLGASLIMTDLMQVLYEYAKEELLLLSPSPEYREVSCLTARLSLRLRDLLPDDDWNTVEKYEDAAARLHSMELEAAFQAAFSLAREPP